MTHEMPFDDDIMTLIMGVTPEAPGQHGRVSVPAPTKDAVSIITQIKDLCEEFLECCKECEDGEKPEKEGKHVKPDFSDDEEPEDE